ncbi:UDP-4-amino-4,6-dideoxy-N-acetyl-beta-L-altrosamine N-acetyltransferase [Heliorestis acidaminivorans]|uniref:UDP-4-amino-4, 6-dideoxy-N-acetyl-beta-L-altrosamine N-acetyltransferase n=1 Tax=Heliorestis acidaminivorans TaxID=553427 RepID=A0A6I0EZL5_9FIRM|nr:UDP-4-amino-4,6-dideoxy-N-acetyl-beta-L-altrosamine N-acetyltransferase [Heliorestis acidaminivorans]KAB2952945.1 UDP-4-amino-4,6-dideoxy-N-acetyl-beta-L-altrosamine N-acetyltransferase [Heliorestis acidaminivorans]
MNFYLRQAGFDDLELIREWRNKEHVRKNSFNQHYVTKEEHKDWFSKLNKDNTKQCLIFILEDVPLGISIFSINHKHQRANWSFYLGETGLPKGTGTKLGFASMDYAFDNFKVQKIHTEVLSYNLASLKFHDKLGFVLEGKHKKHFLIESVFYDVYLFSIFREGWEEKKDNLLMIIEKGNNTSLQG